MHGHGDSAAAGLVGRVIANNFLLEELIGSGAMGSIYRAEQQSLGKKVVIKVLHGHLAGDETIAKRFYREAKAASLLNHPNCIQIIDFGQAEDGMLYIAMEYIDGIDLGELVYNQFPIEARRVIHILRQTCTALDEAHANGVLHRDLKPENIMLEDRRAQRDFVKVLDFGIAKLQDGVGGPGTFQTMAGVVCGTPEYMSPEQARGEELDGRTDLYALGIMLYQMLTGRLPFEGDTPLAVVTQQLSRDPTPPQQLVPDVNPSLANLSLTLMSKSRDKRPQSCLDVVAELDRIERELTVAEARAASGGGREEQTIIEMRPIQLVQEEKAAAERRKKEEAAARAQAEAEAARAAEAESGELSGPVLWAITVGVAVAIAVGGWLVYSFVLR